MKELFITFFKIGAFTIGGGVAMIPIIENEVVDKHGWLTSGEFLETLAIAQASPGVMAANVSAYIGYRLKGFWGAVVCMLATLLPSFLTMLVIAHFFTYIRGKEMVNRIFMGMRPAVAAVIASATYTLATKSSFQAKEWVIMVLIALLISFLGWSPILLILAGGIGSILWHIWKRKQENHD